MSTKPGATTQPSASMVWVAADAPSRPTAVIRPSRTPTSAENAGRPEPSMTVPPRTRRSSSGMREALLVTLLERVDTRRVLADDLALARVRQVLDVLEQLVDHPRILRVGVRKVAGPDEVVLAREVGHRPHRSLSRIEADDAVPPEVLARSEAQLRGKCPLVGLEELVEAVHPVRDPTAAALQHQHLEVGVPFEDAAVHE